MSNPLIPWSYSKLSLYEKCPAQAKYRYVEKIPTPQGAAAGRGTDVHKTIEDYLTGASKKVHEAVQDYKHIFKAVRSKDPFVEHKLAINRNFTLIPWDVSYGRCVLDAAYTEGNEVHVQEWKTGKMYDDHEEQRKINLLFARASWVAHTYTIQTYYFDLGKKKKLVLEHEELDDVRRDLEPRLHIMENDDIMAPRPGHYCGWCSYSRYKGGPCKKG